jgi:hypothetical protein
MNFEKWFLLAYTIYTSAAIAVLMWVGSAKVSRAKDVTRSSQPR